ncbi:MAG: pirin family protein [Candidatus Kapaibacteriales bacterium]
MKKTIHRSGDRGHAAHGWLDTYHSFSFANWYNPERMGFGALRVLNDDTIEGGTGFGTHPHRNMEIVTIPLSGALKHKDSMGNEGVINTGEIQLMSAGKGIFHSEHNNDETEPGSFLQIWIMPDKPDVEPRYDQLQISDLVERNKISTVVSPKEVGKGGWLHQNAYMSIAEAEKGEKLDYKVNSPGNGVYAFVINGKATVAGEMLNLRDAIGISDADAFDITMEEDGDVLLIEVPIEA